MENTMAANFRHPEMVNRLITKPLWRAEDLGRPLPDSRHAISVCLPTWADNIAYEEGEPRVMESLQAGYPRFVYHPLVAGLSSECESRFGITQGFCQVYPSRASAERCLEFVKARTGREGRMHDLSRHDAWAVCLPESCRGAAKKYWQHAGEGISSRRAEAVLENRSPPEDADAKKDLCTRLAELAGQPQDSVFLFPSGMAATYTVYRAISGLFPQWRSVQFGFPYVDTLKIQQDLGSGALFYPLGNQDEIEDLRLGLQKEPVFALFFEFPSNPLLNSPDLNALAAMASEHGFPLVADDTIGTSCNLILMPPVDMVVTSLTKFFVGTGDVMGGAVILNAASPWAGSLRRALEAEYEDTLWAEDALLIEEYSRTFSERVWQINRNAEELCDYLKEHPLVEQVYYPKYTNSEHYVRHMKPGAGFGGLFSFLLRDRARNTPVFFDHLEISKGPSLGTSFSLCCPYTILAHYKELDYAESCGVSRHLIRISVGLEDLGDLKERLERAFSVLTG